MSNLKEKAWTFVRLFHEFNENVLIEVDFGNTSMNAADIKGMNDMFIAFSKLKEELTE